MGLLILKSQPTEAEFQEIRREFEDYIKVVIDIRQEILAAGASLHTDEERLLLENGCLSEDLWGGGLDILGGQFDCLSLINIKPRLNNPSQEILDPELRSKFLAILEKFFPKG